MQAQRFPTISHPEAIKALRKNPDLSLPEYIRIHVAAKMRDEHAETEEIRRRIDYPHNCK